MRRIRKATPTMICAFNYLYYTENDYLQAIRDPCIPTTKQGKGTATQENLLEYLEGRCLEFWHYNR